MPGGWRYIAQRLDGEGGGEFIDWDLPLQNVSINEVLSGHDSFNATISPEYPRLQGIDGAPILTEWSTAIWAEQDGEIRGGGILEKSSEMAANGQLAIECVGLTGYLVDLPYTDATFFVEEDPLNIVRHIWTNVQNKSGGDIGMEVSDLTTNVLIGDELKQVEFDTENGPVRFEAGPFKLAWYMTHDLSQEIDTLADITPFDYRVRHWWDGETLRHKLEIGHPRHGTKRRDLRFVVGENVFVPPDIERDGTQYASEVLVLGAGEGSAMRRGTAKKNTGRLRRVAVVTDPSVRSILGAEKLAAKELAWRTDLDSLTDVVVQDHPHAPIGSVEVGDEIYLQGRSAWSTFDVWVRVLGRTINPGDARSMSLAVTRSGRTV